MPMRPRLPFLAGLGLALLCSSAIAQPATVEPPAAAQSDAIVESPMAAPTAEQQQLNSMRASGATGPDSVGTLPQRLTDFDRKTWRDTPFDRVMELMGALPERMDSAAAHLLARNLLVSIADAPPGDTGGYRLLSRRVEKLTALGNVDDAAALARAAPTLTTDPELARSEIEAELYANQVETACIDLRAFAPILNDDWGRNGLVLCRLRAGETLTETVPPMDVDSLGVLARIGGSPLAADPAIALPPRLVAAVRDDKLSPELRLETAFAAGRASAIDGRALVEIFRSTPTHGELPVDGGPPTDGATAALLYKTIERTADPAMKLALVERGLLSPAGAVDKVSVAMVSALRDVQPTPDLGPLAARFATLFYAVNDVEAAAPWANTAQATGNSAPLWPFRVLVKDTDTIGIGEWQEKSGLSAAQAGRIQIVLSAFGVMRPPARVQPVAGLDLPETPLADLLAIDESARSLRVGETVLRALALLGRGGPAMLNPLTLRRVLANIDSAFLHDEARALAFEAIASTLLNRSPENRAAGP